MDAMREVKDHARQVSQHCVENERGRLWVTMLYGSQNYDLDSADSDVDTKSMLLPSLKMVLMDSSRVSTELTMRDGSLDNLKDVREMFGNYLKGNINFVETLFTPYYDCHCYGGYFEHLRSRRNLVANAKPRRLMHMAAGMAKQKYCAFSHPYEGKKEVLAKYGYDPKQLHHLMRLYYFMRNYMDNQSFYHALWCCSKVVDPELHRLLMQVKLEPYELEYATQLKEEYMGKVDDLLAKADTAMPEDNGYEKAKAFLDDLAVKLLKDHLREEVTRR